MVQHVFVDIEDSIARDEGSWVIHIESWASAPERRILILSTMEVGWGHRAFGLDLFHSDNEAYGEFG